MQKKVIAVIVAVCLAPLPSMADPHSHSADPSAYSFSPDKKFQADETLRTGMANIAGALGLQWEPIKASRLASADYSKLAKSIRIELANVVTNCKLPVESDRAFHEILQDMNRGLDLMNSRRLELQRAGALALVQAVKNYGKHFDHPVWPQTP